MNRAGKPFVILGGLVTLIALILKLWFLVALAAVLTGFLAFFFRDPERISPLEEKVIVSPADGRVVFIGKTICPFNQAPMQKISIFMSLFDVHVNRMPYTSQIQNMEYRPGRFLPAFMSKADLENEANIIFCQTSQNQPFIVVQIAGILARRIICYLKKGQLVKKGERIGIICFGSKVDVYLPEGVKIVSQPGQKVKAGVSIIGYWL